MTGKMAKNPLNRVNIFGDEQIEKAQKIQI